jgi:cobalamin biosynthesis protein CobT
MSAREWIYNRLTGALIRPDDASQRLDDYRDEVRQEILGNDLNPSSLVLDAQAYRRLRDDIFATMDNPDRWDRDADEGSILSDYVKWLADGKPALDDGYEGEGS